MTLVLAFVLLQSPATDALRRVEELGAKGDAKAAIALLMEASRRFPAEPEVYLLWAQLYLRGDRPEPALEAAARALEIRPGHPRGHFLKGVALIKLGRHVAA
ncbi:MAG: tetratricopeptide repeat protein, partial [Bryobacteraceae bacterium]